MLPGEMTERGHSKHPIGRGLAPNMLMIVWSTSVRIAELILPIGSA